MSYQYSSDLQKALADSSFDKSNIWKLDMMFKIATALKKLHDQTICHFDLKPENIFMMNPLTPVLGDLGFARTIDEAGDGFFAGTPIFLGK